MYYRRAYVRQRGLGRIHAADNVDTKLASSLKKVWHSMKHRIRFL